MRTRHQLRALNRVIARRVTRERDIPVTYEPASAPECVPHHRKLPCKRCPGVDA